MSKFLGEVKYLYQENAGGAEARNFGLEKAKGEYVYFLDADDALIEGALAKMVGRVERDESDICIGGSEWIDEAGKVIGEYHTFKKSEVVDGNLAKLFAAKPNPSTKLYKRKIIVDNGLRFANVKIAQDLDFYLKYLLCCKRASVTTEKIYRYRDTTGGITHSYTDRILDIRKVFEDVKIFADKTGKSDFYAFNMGNVELSHICGQMRKVWHMPNKQERRRVLKGLMERYRQIKPNKESLTYAPTVKKIREGNRYVRWWRIYTSNAFCGFAKWVKGKK